MNQVSNSISVVFLTLGMHLVDQGHHVNHLDRATLRIVEPSPQITVPNK